MTQPIEILEFIQCVVAKLFNASEAKISPCLINKTGFLRVLHNAEPAALSQQLTNLLTSALLAAKHSIRIQVCIQQQHLQLHAYIDNNQAPTAQYISSKKVSCSLAVTPLSKPINLVAETTRLQNAIQLVAEHSTINMNSRDVRLADTVTLSEHDSSVALTGSGAKHIQVVNLGTSNLEVCHDTVLFWPFFDTDILILTQNDPSSRALCVLVADDSIPSKLATQIMLEKLGCKVISASDGVEALSLAQQQAFDLILLDERMPGLNGSDVASQLRQYGQLNQNTPKVALTGISDPNEIDTLFNKGITHYLEKPITKLALEKFLQQWQVSLEPAS